MKPPADQDVIIEFLWYRPEASEWTARVTDSQTGASYDVRSMAELEAALQAIMQIRTITSARPRQREHEANRSSADPIPEK